MYLGEFNIDDYIDIVATTHRFSSGAVYAPTGDVTYTVYENANATQIITATAMTNFDSETGLYYDRIQATTALGYEVGKSYMVLIKATVDGVASIDWRTFKVKATITATLDTVKADTVEILTRIPDATAGAEGGLPTVAAGGVKLAQTVDLTAGQSIACSDKTGFSLSATGADLILKSSTFVQAIVAAVNEFATYGLTALNTLLVTTGIKAASIPAVTLADDAITAAKFDESTAFPLKSADTGATAVARTGADSDTLETISDEIAAAKAVIDDIHGTDLPAVKTVVDTIQADTDLLDDAAGGIADIHTDIGTLQTMLTDIHGTDLPAVKTVLDNIHDTDLPAVKTVVDTIQADTDLLDDVSGGLADIHTDIAAIKLVVDLIEDIVRNQLEITDANGNVVLRADNSSDVLYSVAGGITDNLTTTIRKKLA